MVPRNFSPNHILSPRKLIPTILILAVLVSGCATGQPNNPAVDIDETSQNAEVDVFTPVPQGLEDAEAQDSRDDETQLFSSVQLGICFSYPMGYIQLPESDTVAITAPDRPDWLVWLEISDAYDRTALRIADEDMTYAVTQQGVPRANLGWWSITLGGEEAVVLDGMPGQDLQRRVYVVRDQTLYVLAFMPTRSENKAVNDQMEALYAAITSSWSWSSCSGAE